MVILNKIYTRTGDGGETAIGDGTRVSKLDARIIAGGSIDETNSLLGAAVAHCSDAVFVKLLLQLQQQMFDLGADLCCPWDPEMPDDRCPRISAGHVTWLEQKIDTFNAELSELKSFVLPGGSQLSACLHVARSVCRRAEVDTIRLQREARLNAQVIVFLNRLSDLLFVMARAANNNGASDVLWEPGRSFDA